MDITYDEAKEMSEIMINDIENEVNRRLNYLDHNVPIVTGCITKVEKSTETVPVVSSESVDITKLKSTETTPKVSFKTDDNEHSTLLKILSQECLNTLDSETLTAVSLSDILRSPSKSVKESDDARQKFV